LLCYLSKHVGSLIVLNFSRTSTVAFCVVVVVLCNFTFSAFAFGALTLLVVAGRASGL